jgi:hypothetical protein
MQDGQSTLGRGRRLAVGCGMHEGKCLAIGVDSARGKWRIGWALYGELSRERDPAFIEALRRRVGRRHLWAPLVGEATGQEVVCAVDLPGGAGTRLSKGDQTAAVTTQLRARVLHPAEPYVITQSVFKGGKGKSHVLGAAARKKDVDEQYRAWRKVLGIRNPHLSSPAVALANAYFALYPTAKQQERPCRLLICEGPDGTLACCLDGGHLIDTLYVQKIPGQSVTAMHIHEWSETFEKRHALAGRSPLPCVVQTVHTDGFGDEVELWRPFDDAALDVAAEARDLIAAHPILAPIAFGMALQGA